MDKMKKYRKIRGRLEIAASIIALIIGEGICSYLGIYGNKFISLDTLLSLAVITVIAFILNNIAVRIADNWYEKNKEM